MRCELVAVLLHEPKIIFLDEPTIGLDVVAKERIREFIATLNRETGATVLLTTHDLSDIEKLCKRVIIIDKGKLIYDGDLAEIKRKYGRLRRLLFTPEDTVALERLEKELKLLHAGIEVSMGEENCVVIRFDPHAVPASQITRHIVNNYELKDLSVEEADLDQIIRDIYERGQVGGG